MSQGSSHFQPLAILLGPPLWMGWAETSTKEGCESGPAAPSLRESPVGLGTWSPQDQHLLEFFAKRKMARPLGAPLPGGRSVKSGFHGPQSAPGFPWLGAPVRLPGLGPARREALAW